MAVVEDKDYGFDAIIGNLKALGGEEISVGVLRTAGKEKNGTDLVDVAVYNEYGTKKIPPRPFLRQATDKFGSKWQDFIEQCVDKIIARQIGETQALNWIGLKAQTDIQNTIDNGTFKPNAPSTIARKKSSKPLINIGTLRGAIRYRIEE